MLTTILAAMLAAAPGACSAGGEFEPPLCPTGLAPVAALDIEAQGVAIWSEDAHDPPCRSFRLMAADVRRFFRGAARADARDVHFTLPESPCVAQGRFHFSNGTSGRWQVDRFALGWLERVDRPRMTLYCRGCRRKLWMQ